MRINKSIENVEWFEDLAVPGEIFQSVISKKCNHVIYGGENNQYFYPNKGMIKDLEALYQTLAVKQQALKLIIQ